MYREADEENNENNETEKNETNERHWIRHELSRESRHNKAKQEKNSGSARDANMKRIRRPILRLMPAKKTIQKNRIERFVFAISIDTDLQQELSFFFRGIRSLSSSRGSRLQREQRKQLETIAWQHVASLGILILNFQVQSTELQSNRLAERSVY